MPQHGGPLASRRRVLPCFSSSCSSPFPSPSVLCPRPFRSRRPNRTRRRRSGSTRDPRNSSTRWCSADQVRGRGEGRGARDLRRDHRGPRRSRARGQPPRGHRREPGESGRPPRRAPARRPARLALRRSLGGRRRLRRAREGLRRPRRAPDPRACSTRTAARRGPRGLRRARRDRRPRRAGRVPAAAAHGADVHGVRRRGAEGRPRRLRAGGGPTGRAAQSLRDRARPARPPGDAADLYVVPDLLPAEAEVSERKRRVKAAASGEAHVWPSGPARGGLDAGAGGRVARWPSRPWRASQARRRCWPRPTAETAGSPRCSSASAAEPGIPPRTPRVDRRSCGRPPPPATPSRWPRRRARRSSRTSAGVSSRCIGRQAARTT